jgi:Holliday junction resolvase RusA-like endonuclease
MGKDRLRHTRIDLPSYQFVVYERPSSSQRRGNTKQYKEMVRIEATKHIASPILSDDVEVEICWATRVREGIRADIDNIIKPTLDALIGIAFEDDKQIRSVTSTLVDRKKDNKLSVYVEDLGPLIYIKKDDAVQIAVYSDNRLIELGGEETVRKKRNQELDKKFNDAIRQQINNAVNGNEHITGA